MTSGKPFHDTVLFNHLFVIELLNPQDEVTSTQFIEDVIVPRTTGSSGIGLTRVTLSKNLDLGETLAEICRRTAQLGLRPIVHFESHGSRRGMGRTDQHPIPWSAVANYLRPINRACGHNLLTVVATCYGAFAMTGLSATAGAPFWGVVGPWELAFPSEIRKGFTAFYGTLLESNDLVGARESLRAAVDDVDRYWDMLMSAELFMAGFGRYRREHMGFGRLKARERELTVKLKRRHRKQGMKSPPGTRQRVRSQLADDEADFVRLKERFFHCDQFPANRDRYSFSRADCDLVDAARLNRKRKLSS